MAYNGNLNQNEIFSAIYNMIISQEVFADNIGKHQTLVDKARVDGGLFGDTKLYYSTDALKSYAWGKDSDLNVLALHRPAAPNCQAITLNKFRQIALTVDNYLTKRAFADEGAFGSFNSVMLGWMNETKKIYEGTLYNVYVGTTVSTKGSQSQTVTLNGTNDGQTLAEKLANILVEMSDYNRDYNDLGYLRSYNPGDVKVVWNSKYVNKIKKVDTPTIYHNAGLVDKLDEDIMPSRYFGTVITSSNVSSYSASTATTGKPLAGTAAPYAYTPGTNHANGCVRTAVECDIKISNVTKHYFPGDELPATTSVVTSGAVGTSGQVNLGEIYIEDAKVICKIVTKLPPIMSAFEAATSFYNPKALNENHYLTWGYNTLDYFKDKPFVTLKQV